VKKVFKTALGFSDGDARIFRADTIEYQGTFWLVPYWIEFPGEGWRVPERIISLDGLPHQKTPPERSGADFYLNVGIPKCLWDGQIPPGSGDKYVVIEHPDITFPIQNDDQ
jgi:hypothetical protein